MRNSKFFYEEILVLFQNMFEDNMFNVCLVLV